MNSQAITWANGQGKLIFKYRDEMRGTNMNMVSAPHHWDFIQGSIWVIGLMARWAELRQYFMVVRPFRCTSAENSEQVLFPIFPSKRN